MRLSLFVCTTAILAMSSAEFLNDPSVPSANMQARFPRRYNVKGRVVSRGMSESTYDFDDKLTKESQKKMPKELLRNARSVEAYGIPKKYMENNGIIEQVFPMTTERTDRFENYTPRRMSRSILEEPEKDLNDLEAQDAKVFRPLFVYRQQVAKKQKLNRRRSYDPSYSQIYRPWVHRYPTY